MCKTKKIIALNNYSNIVPKNANNISEPVILGMTTTL